MKSHPLLSPERDGELRRAVRLEWITIFFLLTIAVVMYAAMGGSRAMRTAWYEDLLSFIPPIAFLVALHWEKKPPRPDYPYGFLNAATIAFLCAAVALLVFGAWLLAGALRELITASRPSIGARSVAGFVTWSGWWMIAAVSYSAVPPFVLGRMKERIATAVNDDTLSADADMNTADWKTALATAIGVLGIGIGWWWADSAAAALISLSILHDGWQNLARAVRDLVDHVPTDRDGERVPLEPLLRRGLHGKGWIGELSFKLREEGRFITGEMHVVTRAPDAAPTARELEDARQEVLALDWRLHELAWVLAPPTDAAPRSSASE